MKLSEVTTEDILSYLNVDDTTENEDIVEGIIAPAAKARMVSYTGVGVEELDASDDYTIPFLALCSYLFDNRSMATTTTAQTDAVISAFLDAHCINLVG